MASAEDSDLPSDPQLGEELLGDEEDSDEGEAEQFWGQGRGYRAWLVRRCMEERGSALDRLRYQTSASYLPDWRRPDTSGPDPRPHPTQLRTLLLALEAHINTARIVGRNHSHQP